MQHVFIVGAKSLGAYGGYETFVYKLTEDHQHNGELKYHVACKANGDGCMDETRLPQARPLGDGVFELHNARCFKIKVPNIGPAVAIYYDIAALEACCRYVKPGGQLVYSTCSILPEENALQLRRFLENHPDFTLLPLPDSFPAALRQRYGAEGLQLLPHRDHLDGFFIARMGRKP